MALPDIPVGDGLEDEGLVTGVPGHRGHLVQQQPIMVPGHLVIIIIITCHQAIMLTLLGGLLSMEQEMKADLSAPASDLTSASPDLTEGGSDKWRMNICLNIAAVINIGCWWHSSNMICWTISP